MVRYVALELGGAGKPENCCFRLGWSCWSLILARSVMEEFLAYIGFIAKREECWIAGVPSLLIAAIYLCHRCGAPPNSPAGAARPHATCAGR